MYFHLAKIDDSGYKCSHLDCEHKYSDQILNTYFIKQNTIALEIYMNGNLKEIYCYDCIDKLYLKLKPILDKKLWALK